MSMRNWVRLPSQWIDDDGLWDFQWGGGAPAGSDCAAALMVLAPIAHHADDEGLARCTYDQLSLATGLSRSKIANGLSVLNEFDLIDRAPSGRSTFKLSKYNERGGWSKFPARPLYAGGRITAFEHFTLRTMTELHALKLYYLFARRRSNDTNMAHISYEKIEEYTWIDRAKIRRAISLLAAVGLVHVERTPSTLNDYGMANAYRLAHLDPYVHLGTRGRDPDFARPASGEPQS
jgi:hypothetical protein